MLDLLNPSKCLEMLYIINAGEIVPKLYDTALSDFVPPTLSVDDVDLNSTGWRKGG